MKASLLLHRPPHLRITQGLWVPGSRPQRAWLGSEAVFPGTQREQDAEERRQRQRCGGGKRRRTRALVRVRAADKPGRWYGCGRQTKPAAVRGTARAPHSSGDSRRSGAASARQAYLNISLCHTRGAADNFITSADKNDCGRMQMARPSRCLPRSAAGCGRGPAPRPRAPRPARRTHLPTLPPAPRSSAGAPQPVGLGKERGGGGRGNC